VRKAQQQDAPLKTVLEEDNSERENSYYEQIHQLIDEDLVELRELHEELDTNIIAIISGNYNLIAHVPVLFSRYASILGMYSSFDALSATMNKFSKAVEAQPLPKDTSKTEEIFMFLEAFMYILGKWQKDIAEQSDEKINHLDTSIIGDIETITNMWLAEEETAESCEVEFF